MFRANIQKWENTWYFWNGFVLIKGIPVYEIVQANERYLQKVHLMSFHWIVIRFLAHFCVENMM